MANKPIKKIAICTGFDQEEKPVWDIQPIATQSEYVSLSTINKDYSISFENENNPDTPITLNITSGTTLTSIITALLEKINNWQGLLSSMYADIQDLKEKVYPENEEEQTQEEPQEP